MVCSIFNLAPAKSEIKPDFFTLPDIFCVNESEAAMITGMPVASVEVWPKNARKTAERAQKEHRKSTERAQKEHRKRKAQEGANGECVLDANWMLVAAPHCSFTHPNHPLFP